MNISTRKEFRKYRAHHPQSSVERFHIARHHNQVQNLRECFFTETKKNELHRVVILEDNRATPLKLADTNFKPLLDVPSTKEQLIACKK